MSDALNLIATEILGVPPQLRVAPMAQPHPAPAASKRIAQANVTYQYCAWSALRYEHTHAIRDWFAAHNAPSSDGPARYAPATANRMLAALRGVLKEAWRLGEMSDKDYYRAIDVPGVRATTLPRGRCLTRSELSALLGACRRDPRYYARFPKCLPRDARDAALIAMLSSIGLRRFEIVALDLDDYDTETGAVHIRHGNRRRARLSLLPSGAMATVDGWLAVRGMAPGPLFTALYKGGIMSRRRLTDQAIYHILQVRQREAHIAPFSPDDLRRTCADDLCDAGVNSTTRPIAVRAGMSTTARHDCSGDQA